ncbi:MAG: radical SAM protein, partial [Desulfamplus sp.]|nr:radical SAM protein [Desulfamplus sp.]
KVGVPFSINSRVEKMTGNFCHRAADANCDTIWFGIESGDYQFRKTMLGRKMTNDQIILAAKNCHDAGINRLTFNMVGMPFEKKEQMMQTLRLNETIAPEFFYFFTYIPLKGTKLFEIARENDLLIDESRQKVHYLDDYDHGFSLNIREHPQGMSNNDFNDVCQTMKRFQDANNRLSH